MNKSQRVILSNAGEYGDYEYWKEQMLQQGYTEEDNLTEDAFYEDQQIWYEDECSNLNQKVDGVIIAFAVIGTWRGDMLGYRKIGNNIKDILQTSCDIYHFFCDRWNVKAEMGHHDGRNHITYRIAKDEETANRICERIYNNDMDYEAFRKATKSLRPYVAKVYGW